MINSRDKLYPEHAMNIKATPGKPTPLGATATADGINFAIQSRSARQLYLLIYPVQSQNPIEFPMDQRTGDIWHIHLSTISMPVEYSYKIFTETNHEYNISDPYSHALTGAENWADTQNRKFNSLQIDSDFDWEDDKSPGVHYADSIIYELHVRGFTKHASSGVSSAGTFKGLIEKIPYLKELGVTTIELLPITEFDETGLTRTNTSGDILRNYWGYDPINFFAPKAGYSGTKTPGSQLDEFKKMVKELHKAGIEIILDVVFNHTAEGDAQGKTYNLRALDNSLYYMMKPNKSEYLNFSGCGNTVNANHPLVSDLIINALRFWVSEMHVDGFRFDLASVLSRDENGSVLDSPPVVERISKDPVLSNTKLIAEAWDAGGLYQVGKFPGGKRWAEWNGIYRDDIRRYIKGDPGLASAMATRIAGSADLYQTSGRAPYHSINFMTCHDGFTLSDLVSYNHKYNIENGENNRDGSDLNLSWNCGFEGPSSDPAIMKLRKQQIKNFFCLLMVSQGTPMILAGDEIGRTQNGNNNAYCQDNDIGWVIWDKLQENQDIFRFVKLLIAFRKSQPNLRRQIFFDEVNANKEEIHWHGRLLNKPDWSNHSLSLAFHLLANDNNPDDIYVISNVASVKRKFQLPDLQKNKQWYEKCNTSKPSTDDIHPEGDEKEIDDQNSIQVDARSTLILISK
jgi:glycogen operon protein